MKISVIDAPLMKDELTKIRDEKLEA
jgi:hypothetical protein